MGVGEREGEREQAYTCLGFGICGIMAMAVLNGSNTWAPMLPRAGVNPASSLLQRCKQDAKMAEVKICSKGGVGVGGGIEEVGGPGLRLNMGMMVAKRRLLRVKCGGDSVQKVVGENSSNVSSSSINIKPSEELLDRWAKEPAPRSGKNPESEAVRRLFMWDALPKKGAIFFSPPTMDVVKILGFLLAFYFNFEVLGRGFGNFCGGG